MLRNFQHIPWILKVGTKELPHTMSSPQVHLPQFKVSHSTSGWDHTGWQAGVLGSVTAGRDTDLQQVPETPLSYLSCAPQHTWLMEADFMLHISQQIAPVIWRSASWTSWGGKCLTVTCRHTSGFWRSVRRGASGISFVTQGTFKVLRLKESGWGLTAHPCLPRFPQRMVESGELCCQRKWWVIW